MVSVALSEQHNLGMTEEILGYEYNDALWRIHTEGSSSVFVQRRRKWESEKVCGKLIAAS